MRMRTDRRPGRGPAATKTWSLRAAALACALMLAACSGGGGGESPPPPDSDTMPPPAAEPAAALVSALQFEYTLARSGERPIEEDGSVPLGCPAPGSGAAGGCAPRDLRELAGRDGTGTRDGFGTVTGTTGGPPLTRAFSGASATVTGASFTRYGFWGKFGYAALEIGAGTVSASVDGEQWSGSFKAAHAWTAGTDPSGTNPSGTGSVTWQGIAEAARTADFAHLSGTAALRIPDLSRPLIDVDIDLHGGGGVALRWEGMAPAAGAFRKGAAGTDRIDGRFHGPAHEEAWGTFDTGAYVGAFGAKRE